jgi:hypothetical protein
MINWHDDVAGVDPNGSLLRHFDSSGRLIGSAISRAEVDRRLRLNHGYLAASKDRAGWYSPIFGREGKYVEVSYDGKVETFAGLPAQTRLQKVTGIALTDSGEVFATLKTYSPNQTKLFVLDREARTWSEALVPTGSRDTILYGANGDSLAFQGEGKTLKFFGVKQ